MYSQQLIGLIVALAALVHYSEAVTREEMPQCIEQLVARLSGFEIDPIMLLVLDRGFPENITDSDYDKEIDTKELSETVCVTHHQRLYETLKDLKCHKEFIESPEYTDEYGIAILRLADRHTKFCILGVGVCEAHKRKLNIMHDEISHKFGR